MRVIAPIDRDCVFCGKPLFGRADKFFCNDYCRSSHNNKALPEARSVVGAINHILRKNRKIMKGFLGGEKQIQVHKHVIESKGFNFEFFTQRKEDDNGTPHYYCYEYHYFFFEDVCVINKPSIISKP